jgi:hypothetical protein
VEATSFELEAGAPAAELELATVWDGSPVRFLVTSASPRVELVVSDWLRRERFRLVGPGGGGVAGPIAFGAAPAWRQHRFWWPARVPYQVRLVRLRLESPDGAPARARLRYLGPSELPTAGFEREVVVATLPDGGTSGTPGEARVELVHRGGWTWSARGPVPVRLALRFEPIEGEALRAGAVEHRAPLPRDVAPGERVAIALPFLWPPQPGRWRARLDLVLEDVAWFGDRTGGPIVEREVRVTRAEAAAPSAPADPRGRTEP